MKVGIEFILVTHFLISMKLKMTFGLSTFAHIWIDSKPFIKRLVIRSLPKNNGIRFSETMCFFYAEDYLDLTKTSALIFKQYYFFT